MIISNIYGFESFAPPCCLFIVVKFLLFKTPKAAFSALNKLDDMAHLPSKIVFGSGIFYRRQVTTFCFEMALW